MKIISWNLLHGRGATAEEIMRLIHHEKPDLLLMQEATEAIDRVPERLGGHYARAPLPGRRHGLAAWSPRPFREPPATLTLQPGLFVRRICQIILFDRFSVANVHLSHGQIHNRRQLRRIAGILPARAMIVGDCNMVGPPLLEGFKDAGPRLPTHLMADILALRLDRCLVRGLAVEATEVLGRATSDHRPIAMRVVV